MPVWVFRLRVLETPLVAHLIATLLALQCLCVAVSPGNCRVLEFQFVTTGCCVKVTLVEINKLLFCALVVSSSSHPRFEFP